MTTDYNLYERFPHGMSNRQIDSLEKENYIPAEYRYASDRLNAQLAIAGICHSYLAYRKPIEIERIANGTLYGGRNIYLDLLERAGYSTPDSRTEVVQKIADVMTDHFRRCHVRYACTDSDGLAYNTVEEPDEPDMMA